MNVAFITESNFSGKYPRNFDNIRTEIAWQIALDSTHFPFSKIENVKDFDFVFVIIPKGRLFLSAEGSQIVNGHNPLSELLRSDFVNLLKCFNKKVYFIQEGNTTWMSDASVEDQFNWLNRLSEFHGIFAHNINDVKFYRGLLPDMPVFNIQSLMIEDGIKNIAPVRQNKVMIGGNFSRFYGGFYSYVISQEFENCEFYTMDSHSKRPDEHLVPNLKHFPRLNWNSWMRELSTFKYGIHLMPTVAAGTFSLNCAYFGIPCIGNERMDTQRILFPDLSVDVEDLEKARKIANLLNRDDDFYNEVSQKAKYNYKKNFHIDFWLGHILNVLNAK